MEERGRRGYSQNGHAGEFRRMDTIDEWIVHPALRALRWYSNVTRRGSQSGFC